MIVEAVTQEEAERVTAVLEGQVLKPKKACSEGTSDSRRKSRSAYPGDDCFDQADLDAALRAGLSRQEAKIELAKFRDYNIARDSRFADWHAAWRSWVTNSIKYRSNRGPASGSGGPSMADLINDL